MPVEYEGPMNVALKMEGDKNVEALAKALAALIPEDMFLLWIKMAGSLGLAFHAPLHEFMTGCYEERRRPVRTGRISAPNPSSGKAQRHQSSEQTRVKKAIARQGAITRKFGKGK